MSDVMFHFSQQIETTQRMKVINKKDICNYSGIITRIGKTIMGKTI